METGLIGSFDNILSGFTVEELERANVERPHGAAPDTPLEGGVAVSSDDDGAVVEDELLGAFAGSRRTAGVAAPPIDPRARLLAQRLAGTTSTGAKTAASQAWAVQLVNMQVVRLDQRNPGPLVIGRDAPLVDLAVASRRHCQIVLDNGTAFVSDLGSTNGTYISRSEGMVTVGGEPVAMRDGDVVCTAGGAATLATVSLVAP